MRYRHLMTQDSIAKGTSVQVNVQVNAAFETFERESVLLLEGTLCAPPPRAAGSLSGSLSRLSSWTPRFLYIWLQLLSLVEIVHRVQDGGVRLLVLRPDRNRILRW